MKDKATTVSVYKADIELVRIIAVVCIIVNHTCHFEYSGTSIPGFIGEAWFIFSRIGVPLFLMVSGALLIPKNEDLKSVFRRVVRILVVLIIFGFGYYILDIISFNNFHSIKESIITISADTWKQLLLGLIGDYFSGTPLWYLYMYMGLLLCLPFFSLMFRNIDRKLCIYYLIVSLAIPAISPLIEENILGFKFNTFFGLPLFCNIGGCVLLGHFIYNVMPETLGNKTIDICFAGLLLVLFVSTLIATFLQGGEEIVTQGYFVNLTLMAALLFTVICKGRLKDRLQLHAGRIVVYMGRNTFGIFLFERMVRNKLNDWMIYEKLRDTGMGSFVGTLVFQAGRWRIQT